MKVTQRIIITLEDATQVEDTKESKNTFIIKAQKPKAELLQLNRTQFPSLGIFVNKNVGNRKN